ncbi:MAG: thioredoxin [Nitrospirales bacterium]|nr:MAG: thioredoxin [Nitrospirales bacterium]
MAIIGLTLLTFLYLAHGAGETACGTEPVQAPTFTLPSLQGQSVSLNDYKGQVVLLNFWATWCRDCVREMPEFEKLYQAYKEKGLSVLAIALDKEGRPAVEAFLEDEHLELTYPILLDPEEQVARSYRLSWVPVTVVMGRDSQVIETILGARPWGSVEVMNSIELLLNTRGDR